MKTDQPVKLAAAPVMPPVKTDMKRIALFERYPSESDDGYLACMKGVNTAGINGMSRVSEKGKVKDR